MLSRRYHHTPLLMARGVARLIGSSRREGRHDVIVLNARYWHRVLASSIDHDHTVGSTGFSIQALWRNDPCLRRRWVCSG